MFFSSVLRDYFNWHYRHAFREMFQLWLNFSWFLIHLFSLSELVHAWFAPFKRITEKKTSSFDFKAWTSSILINSLSRLIGALARSVLILCGVLSIVILTLGYVIVMVFWLVAPAAVIAIFGFGLSLILTSLVI